MSASHFAKATPVFGVASSPDRINGNMYNYIVIGGDLAGLTVAGCLSENSAVSVLVIEVGPDSRDNPAIFEMYESVAENAALDWQYLTCESEADVGWNWDKMLHYTRKSENFMPQTPDQLSKATESIPAVQASATNASGVIHCPDLSAGNSSYVSTNPISINYNDDDQRSSSAESQIVTNLWQLLPFGRGLVETVSLTSPPTLSSPDVHINYFNVSFDMDVMLVGLQLVQKIFKTPPLSNGISPSETQQALEFPVPVTTTWQHIGNHTSSIISGRSRTHRNGRYDVTRIRYYCLSLSLHGFQLGSFQFFFFAFVISSEVSNWMFLAFLDFEVDADTVERKSKLSWQFFCHLV
ncbi:hypothetical protein MVEN_01146900 [Mycena venus]|uniref:Glucose-methanol-choline oxidoreductase N-terminal domain-containing protein n=1 Tax=Mycena venus TaxID=2733690 RepID=A0A8H6Y447_9AGAR|nr:hypothetical protein MVEN_01146900 [Mycena venus]